MMKASDYAQAQAMRRVRDDLLIHAAHCARIKTKDGRLVALQLNEAQRRVHDALQAQLQHQGKVRALVLKYRQGGISTYIAERFYHRVSTRLGQSAFIIAHEEKATNNLFEMVKRLHENNPLAPSTKASNAKELIFGALDGGYKLATAGSRDVGRSHTVQMLHGSEFAFWANAQTHLAGIGNTVSDMPGTEIILESTANGVGNAFHELWQHAEMGGSEWAAIFLPWFLQAEYRSPVRTGLELSSADVSYQQTYGLDLEQMQWRANKLAAYGRGFEWLFCQEYPATAAEAFQSSTLNPLISPGSVMAAVNSRSTDVRAALVLGCDPAGDGVNDADRTAIVFRRGRMVERVEYHQGLDTMQIAGRLAQYWCDEHPDALFVDKGGLGAGVHDRLLELNIPVVGINSASRANDPERYENKRAEMWWTMKEWLDNPPCRLPNDAALISDLSSVQPRVSSNGRRMLEKKEDMKRRGVRSPDGADALALTFAMPVLPRTDPVLRTPRRIAAPTSAGY